MVYDGADKYVLLYGGSEVPQFPNSTWKFVNGNWINITHGRTPGSLFGGAIAYDAFDGYVLLFSGGNQTATLDKTWSFVGGNWTEVNVTGTPPTPAGPYNTDPMVYDPLLESVIYFYPHSNYTYLYQSGAWKQVYAPEPSSLQAGGSLAFDPNSGLVLYFGGGSSPQTYAFNGTAWTSLVLTVSPPSAPFYLFTYDGEDNSILYLTGFNHNQTWMFGAGNVSFAASPESGGRILIAGSYHGGNSSEWLPFGVYSAPTLAPNLGFHGTNLSINGKLTPENGSYVLTGNATLSASFQPFPTVALAIHPPDCDLGFNGTRYANGSSPFFAPGSFALVAPNCHGDQFDRWLASGNASVSNPTASNTTVTLTGTSSLTALYVANISFQVTPPFLGSIIFNGSVVVLDSPHGWVAQSYSLAGLPAPGWRLTGFTATGGLTLAPGRVIVASAGSIQANFVPFPSVTFASSLSSCASIQFNGSSYSVGVSSSFDLGNYPISAPVCPDALFVHWTGTGGISLALPRLVNSTANVSGNGTLEAVYGPAAWVNVSVLPSSAAGAVSWNGTTIKNGSQLETLDGRYAITAQPAKGWQFVDWKTGGGATILDGNLTLNSNATVTADFVVSSTPPGNGSGGGAAGVALWEWGVLAAMVVSVGLAVAILAFRRRKPF
jgi:hypothetical protein